MMLRQPRLFWSLLLFVLMIGVPAARADTSPSIPINQQTVDMISWVTQSVDSMITNDGGLFVGVASTWLTNFAVFALVLIGLRMAYTAISHRHFAMDWATLGQFVFTFLICSLLLRYYNSPLPWGGVSFHQLFTENARFLASYIDISNMNRVIAQIHQIVAGTERPSIWDPVSIIVYCWLIGEMFLIEALLFVITAFGFVATGVFVVLGPLTIPTLMFRGSAWIFWGWFRGMLTYSFYRVIASAYVFVWCSVLMMFFQNVVTGSYDLGHFLRIIGGLTAVLFAFGYGAFKVAQLTSDFFTGAAGAGASAFSAVTGLIRSIF
ncbi:MAG: hypothetical protein WA324_00945 [Bryobacteraceae bacterium]